MWKNYVTVALRNLRRQRGYAALNVAGLAVGLACCALIGLYCREELAYDDWHAHADEVYRITSDWGDFAVPATSWPLIEAFRADYPQVEMTYFFQNEGTVRRGDRYFREANILFAPPTFFDVLSFRLAQGQEATVLAEPYSAVLSRRMAEKYFGDADPIGQTLTLYGQNDVTVAGVLEDPPGPSHIKPDFVVSWSSLDAAFDYTANQGWGNNSQYTYLRVPEGMEPEALAAAFPALIERHAGDDWNGATLGLQPLTSIHLHSALDAELEPNGRMAYVVLFAAVAGFILVLACVNFMNLATARSLERAKEVGVRKSIGAQRGQLAGQFLAEATLLALFGLGIAFVLVLAALPLFRGLADRPLALDAGTVLPAVLAAFLLTLGVGLLAGSYPALVLSGFRPAEVLRGRFAASGRGARLRQGLVVFQFAIAVVLIVGTLGVHTQLRYLREADLGFDEAQVVSLPIPTDSLGGVTFLEALRRRPRVLAVAASGEDLPSDLLDGDGVGLPGSDEEEDFVPTRTVSAGHGWFDVLGVPFVAGRDFRAGSASDSAGVVLNETAARMVLEKFGGRVASIEGLVGQEVMGSQGQAWTVLGVVEDFNMATLHDAVEPVAFYVLPGRYDTFLARVAPGSATGAIEALRAVFTEVYPDALFEYRFTDAAFDAAYRNEERLGQLFSVFAGLAVFIACLGLFGLAAYAAQRRTKEIGVRKVLGASAASLVGLLSKDFAKLVLVAILVGVPVAWLAMDRWLDGFAYRAGLSAEVFVAAGALALAIALATVSTQALRAASTDPVKALRYE